MFHKYILVYCCAKKVVAKKKKKINSSDDGNDSNTCAIESQLTTHQTHQQDLHHA